MPCGVLPFDRHSSNPLSPVRFPISGMGSQEAMGSTYGPRKCPIPGGGFQRLLPSLPSPRKSLAVRGCMALLTRGVGRGTRALPLQWAPCKRPLCPAPRKAIRPSPWAPFLPPHFLAKVLTVCFPRGKEKIIIDQSAPLGSAARLSESFQIRSFSWPCLARSRLFGTF